ncbi:LamG-like jellyroll fold domain-containing protein [Gemmata sp.]|uniref:LamG domain-containing protein n=1 Tax=Gemmata sp. TaxID=1914242 RepID=UPI003F7023C8
MPRLLALAALLAFTAHAPAAEVQFRAGAASVDVTPEKFPVVVNCGFVEATGTQARDRLHARALVLDDGTTRLAVVVVDSCMMPREFLDRVKELVAGETKIPADRQLVSATHTHTAPAVMGCLGSDPDPNYAPFLERQIVQAVRQAVANLAPAKAGWAAVAAPELTNNRQWILRSDKVRNDPFGKPTVRSNMHPGHLHADFVGPSGPTDPWLSLLSVRTAGDKPLAVLANFSMHYFGTPAVSADYFGRFCATLEKRVAGPDKDSKFVALMSQGTAGDLHWMDYGRPQVKLAIDDYAAAVAEKAEAALKGIEYRTDVPLAMAEQTLTLDRRLPDKERLAWAQKVVDGLKGAKPKTQPEIYAREAVLMHADPRRELRLQAVRVGDLGIAAIPNEVFALTGLKIKAQSPLPLTFTVELANGAEGYIPPAEQHVLGGYTTWPARSAALEVGAEARVTEAVVGLLEKVAGKKRLALPDAAADAYAKRVLADKPVAYWRLGDLTPARAADLAGKFPGEYEPGVVFGLAGPVARPFDGQAPVNRAAHFAGGRVLAKLPPLGDTYTVEAWFWNGFPAEVRSVTGVVFSLADGDGAGDALELAGKKGGPDRVAFSTSLKGAGVQSAKTAVPYRTWAHAALTREGNRVRVYLNGQLEIDAKLPREAKPDRIVIGGRPDKGVGFEGRVAEVAVYDRVLTAEDLAARLAAAEK